MIFYQRALKEHGEHSSHFMVKMRRISQTPQMQMCHKATKYCQQKKTPEKIILLNTKIRFCKNNIRLVVTLESLKIMLTF